ncbi:MAG: hypothetical protein JW750_12440 [Anaerolineaceae bacterium]|nr:hypothetical protein [Anaerolineaceae bacterium]
MYELSTKPNLRETVERFESWWLGEDIGRPIVQLYVREPKRKVDFPISRHSDLRSRWMDVEFQVEWAVALSESNHILADTLPVYMPNLGPDLTTTLFDCDLEFGADTSWVNHPVETPGDWEAYLHMPLNFRNIYWQTIEEMTRLAIERSDHRFLVAQPDLHGSYDILAGLRNPQHLCTDLYDCPETILKMAERGVEAMVAATKRSFELTAGTGMGSSSWLRYHHSGPAYIPSCDFLALVSRRMGEKFVYPTIHQEMEPLERSIFHLDGPTSLQHLDFLLQLEKLNAVQWVYGEGNGPADKWIHIYQQCLEHGKGIYVYGAPRACLNILKTLGPRGIWFDISEPFNTVDEANAFLAEVDAAARLTPSVYRA